MSNFSKGKTRIALAALFWLLDLTSTFAEISLGELNLIARRWGVDQGHLGVETLSLAQTPDGSIWVANRSGLVQIRGQQITRIDTLEVPEVNHHIINRLCVGPKENLWMTTPKNAIYRLRQGTFTRASLPPSPGVLSIWCPHAEEGVIACYFKKKVLSIYQVTADQHHLLYQGPDPLIRAVHMSATNQVWFSMRDGSIAELSDRAFSPVPTSSVRKVGGFLTRPDRSTLALGSHGTYLLEAGHWKEHLRFSTPLISRLPPSEGSVDQDGRLWLTAQRSGLWVCQPNGNLQKIAAGRNSIPGTIDKLLTDQEGNIWASSFSGLYQLRYSPFVTRSVPSEITSPRVIAVKTDREGSTWFSCFGGIARLVPGQDESELVIPRPIVEVTQFAPENSRSVWLANKDVDFFHWNGSDLSRIKFPRISGALVPTGLEVDHDGKAWLTSYAGVFYCDPKKLPLAFELVSGTSVLPKGAYQSVRIDDQGSIFLSGRALGIFTRKKGATRWSRFTDGKSASFLKGGPIAPHPEEGVWYLAPKWPLDKDARGSLGLVSTDKHFSIPLKDLGIRVDLASSMEVDEEDGLWIQSSIEGLFRLSRSEVMARFHDSSVKPNVTHFGLPHGLKSLGGTFSSNGLRKSSDGRIWAATQEGLSAISPTQWLQETQRVSAPPLFLNRITIDQEAVAFPTSKLSVPPDAFTIEFAFDTLSFGFPSEHHFQHRLVGASDIWQDNQDLRKVTYQKLPPGDYRFEVRATDRFGAWSGESLTLPITVLPHWWEKGSIQASILILVIALGLLLVHLRLRSMRRKTALQENFSRQLISSQEQERKRIAGELHDSLGQSLLIVKNLAVLGERQASPNLYPEISESVGEALEQVRAISRDLRPPELDHLGITKALRSSILRLENSTEINFTSHVDEINELLTPDQEISLYRILQESLNNVVKHAKASQVTILISKKDRSVELLIQDDGCGFNAQDSGTRQKGIGLSNMRERALLAEGSFTIESSSAEGTKSHIVLPLRVSPTENT